MPSSNLRLGLWVNDLQLGVKAGLNAAVKMRPESLGLDAFDSEINPRTIGLAGRRDLARHVRNIAPLAALVADVGGRRLSDPKTLDLALLRIREALDLAQDTGAARLVVPLGFIPAKPEENDPSLRTLNEAAAVLVALASSSRCVICIRPGGEPAQTLFDFLEKVDSSGILALDFAPGSLLSRDVEIVKAFGLLSRRVSMATAVEHYRGGGEAPFGKGDVRWGELFAAMSTLNSSLPADILAGCGLQCDRAAALSQALTRLREVRQNPF